MFFDSMSSLDGEPERSVKNSFAVECSAMPSPMKCVQNRKKSYPCSASPSPLVGVSLGESASSGVEMTR